MNINKFKYFFLDAVKNLKRNIGITFFSLITISATLFIVGLFLLYLFSVDKNAGIIFVNNKDMIIVLKWLEVIVFFVLPIVSIILIVNAFKMVVFHRRNEINIMKLVGATSWFIRWPFIIEGEIIGILGAFAGNILLLFLYSFVYYGAMEFIPELSLVQPTFILKEMFFPFEIVGALVGPIASIIALREVFKT